MAERATQADRGAASVATAGTGAYLLDQFEEFHGELSRLVEQARAGGPRMADQARRIDQLDDARLPIGLLASEARERLQSLLEMQALESGRRGGDFGLLYYKDAQYVMAVLADEVFIALDWPGREAWKNDLLETRLFGSYNAGDQFFQRLEALLAQGDRAQPELALVYLQALGLGFKGRFRGLSLTPKLDDYRRRLFEYVYRKRPDLADPARVLSPQAYRHTVAEATPRLLPDPRLWLWVLGGVFLTYLIVAHVVWTGYTAELRALLSVGG